MIMAIHRDNWLYGIVIAMLASGVSVPAAADNRGALYAYAKVISAEPIRRYVAVRTPVRECWQESETYVVKQAAPGTGLGILLGAVAGGVVGNQFGSGSGNHAATALGSVAGATLGYNMVQRRYGSTATEYTRPVERCETRMREHREERIDGYRVVYKYRGQKYATDMPYDPGRELRVRVDVRPSR
jgi:uncharacterized protein YcfJ